MSFSKKYVIIFVMLVFSSLSLLGSPATDLKPANAWSGDTHGWLSEVAIRLMPEPWSTDLMVELQFFLDNSREPDRIRGDLTDPVEYAIEEPRHFIDADVRPDLYGNATHHPQPPFDISRNSADPRLSSDYQLGVASWAAENWSIQLTEDLQTYAWDSDTVLMDMCMLAHYVQDSWMPFHAVSYYDGQMVPSSGPDAGLFYGGGQSGVHGFVESSLLQNVKVDEVRAIYDTISGSAQYVVPYMASLRGILSGQEVTDQILDIADVLGYTFGSIDWINAIWDNLGGPNGNLTKRLINASFETANVWYTAFVDAGLIVEPTTTEEPTTTTEAPTTEDSDDTTTTTTTTEEETTPFLNYIQTLLALAIPLVIYQRRKGK
ncbi:MAG: hypothetical protein ACW98F_13035 [Candidatus Hodarchaeales archaeon]|jgi:hypothetical protein